MKKWRSFIIGLVCGGVIAGSVPVVSAAVKQYVLVQAPYPTVVAGELYDSGDAPILNHNGTTYVPLRAVGDLLGASVKWNAAVKRVEINRPDRDSAYRNIIVSGANGTYKVTGEARVFEAVMSYAVSDGHQYLVENFHTLKEGAPAWSPFSFTITIPKEKLPKNGTLILELFEHSAKDGSRVNELYIPMERFGG